MALQPGFDPLLLSRIEDAGLNASAPPQQRWMDGWLLRLNPGKAKRARCVQPVADGPGPLDQRLADCAAVFADAGLPLVLRLTPFSRPAGLAAELSARGWTSGDATRVMVRTPLATLAAAEPWPAGVQAERVDHAGYAAAVGGLRGSAAGEIAAHAQRLALSPVPYRGWLLRSQADGALLACGQTATEGVLTGLYDVFTAPRSRGQGLARRLCLVLLREALAAGAQHGYLQVEADNHAARAVYHRLGFADGYSYQYWWPPGAAAV